MPYKNPNKPLEEADMIEHSQEWLNQHGQPSYSYLKKLLHDNNPASKEDLLEIAENYNIPYDESTSLKELVEKIRLFMNLGTGST